MTPTITKLIPTLLCLLLIIPIKSTTQPLSPEQAEAWMKEAQSKFDPSSWSDSDECDSLKRFLQILDSNDEVYVFFYNKQDKRTFSASPFFKTTSRSLHDMNPSLPILTVNMETSKDISSYYGLPGTHSISMYFFQGTPIVLKMNQIEKSQRPVFNWMEKMKQKVGQVRKVESEDDLDAFENSSILKFLIINKEDSKLGNMFAALSANYPELGFSYMVRSEATAGLEEQINKDYDLRPVSKGSNFIFFF